MEWVETRQTAWDYVDSLSRMACETAAKLKPLPTKKKDYKKRAAALLATKYTVVNSGNTVKVDRGLFDKPATD